jgi:O-antigen ligase
MVTVGRGTGALAGSKSPSLVKRGTLIFLQLQPAALGGLVVAFLVSHGYWYLVLGMLLAIPGFLILHRYPVAVVMAWVIVLPLVGETESAALRMVYWLFHRALPVAALVAIVLSALLGLRETKLPRLGWPEVFMGGYIVASLLSIVFGAPDLLATTYTFYDNVFIPMCLYMVVRLVEPDERDLKRLLKFVVLILLSQTVLGLISWKAPHLLPPEWLGKLGERTTGSLRAPEVFGATMIFCGALVLHAGMNSRRQFSRTLSTLLFGVALLMVFLSFSRSVWLAGILTFIAVVYLYRGFSKQLLILILPVAFLLGVSGLLSQQAEYAQQRLGSSESEESALSRLPVMYAAYRMFETKPVLGWGYDSFDRFDRQFQRSVGNLISPTKDHASHNLFLTTLAEQGIVGFLLLGGPMLISLFRTRSALVRMPREGLMGQKLLLILWVTFGCFVLVNNTYRMQTAFALGMWWLVGGLIASIVARNRRDDGPLDDRGEIAPLPAVAGTPGGGS